MSSAIACCSYNAAACYEPRQSRSTRCNSGAAFASTSLPSQRLPTLAPRERALPLSALSTSLPQGYGASDTFYPQSCSLSTPSESAAYPDYEEEHETFASAFSHAFDDAKPERLRIEGLQEFAAALWGRRRIPSRVTDPVLHVFTEFDKDNDGRLTAAEIASALQSRSVKVSEEQIQWAINAWDERQSTGYISAAEWPDFVFALAAADLRKDHDLSGSISGSDSIDGDVLLSS